jgi:hypothetical protein
MSETPLLNDDAARSTTGEILDQSQTAALEARRAETEAARIAAETKTTPDPKTPESTPPSSESPKTTPSDDTTKKPPDPEAKTTDPKDAPAYTDFKAPDGYTIDPKLIEQATPIFKELGLTQDQAQKLVDIQIAQQIAAAKAPAETLANTRKGWVTEAQAHPELKGKLDPGGEVSVTLGRALDALGDPALAKDFRAAMDLTGAGDNPAFIRTMFKMAAKFVEGSHVAGAKPSPLGQVDPTKPTKPTPAQSMYPNLASADRG